MAVGTRPDAAHHLAGDHLLAAYLAATGLLALSTLTAAGAALAAAHALVAAGLWRMAGPEGDDGLSFPAHAIRFLRIFLPVAVTPLLYAELQHLNQLVSPGYLDGAVQAWEAAVFGEQLSLTAARRLPSVWLSEALHFGYVSYYVVVPAAAVAVYRNRGGPGLARLTATVALAFFVCYLCFAVFPVAGPRYEFARIAGPQADGVFFSLVHAVLEAGSSKGTAFPSSHVAAAAAAVLACRRDARRWFWLLAPLVVLLTLGTVYGRFHYGVDAAAGLVVAFGAWRAAPWLVRRLGRPAADAPRQPSAGRGYPKSDHGKGAGWTNAS